MPNQNRIPSIRIEDARLMFRNFSGKEKEYNPAGRRNFCVLINNADAPDYIAQGWPIKYLKPREQGDEPQAYMEVAVNFANVPPKIILINSLNKKVQLDEESVSQLDFANIETVDIEVTPYRWNFGGKEGIRAYLKQMYVRLVYDALEAKWADPGTDGEIDPFTM